LPVSHTFNEEQSSLLQLFSASLFITKNIFSTKSNFFDQDNFDQIGEFSYLFSRKNISNLNFDQIPLKYIYKDKF
jgi:hypothetical protein